MIRVLRHLRHRPSLMAGLAVTVLVALGAALSGVHAVRALLVGWDCGVAAYGAVLLWVMRRTTTDGLRRVSSVLDDCLLYTSPSPRDRTRSRMPSSA